MLIYSQLSFPHFLYYGKWWNENDAIFNKKKKLVCRGTDPRDQRDERRNKQHKH